MAVGVFVAVCLVVIAIVILVVAIFLVRRKSTARFSVKKAASPSPRYVTVNIVVGVGWVREITRLLYIVRNFSL